jgi:hypothetical protein
MIIIRYCNESDIENLQKFIIDVIRDDEYLGHNTEYFRWQYYNEKRHRYNIIIAVDELNNEIFGMFGFIPIYHYDSKLYPNNDIWGTIWIIDENKVQDNGLGLKIYYKFLNSEKPISYGAIGTSDMGQMIYKAFKYKTSILNHYYYLNKINTLHKVALIVKYHSIKPSIIYDNYSLIEVFKLDNITITECNTNPKKSLEYIKNRYLLHPVFNYRIFAIAKNNIFTTLLVIKDIEVNGGKCLRIVDMLGKYEMIKYCNFDSLLAKENAEYIDCLNYGIDEEVFNLSGFQKRDNTIIIPEHFDPFEQKNVDVKFAYYGKKDERYVVFKGDGSLDRPSRFIEEYH